MNESLNYGYLVVRKYATVDGIIFTERKFGACSKAASDVVKTTNFILCVCVRACVRACEFV